MHRHLVAVKVGVKGRTHQRMQFNCPAFNQHRLKSLNTKTVQSRRAVKQNGMLDYNLFQHVPDFCASALYKPLGALYIVSQAQFHQPLYNKGLEQL